MSDLYSLIPELMERFDFKKVHRVMKFLNWRWMNTSRGYDVPTIAEIETVACDLLNRSVREFMRNDSPRTGMTVSTGGFSAIVETFESGQPRLQLLFYVDEVSSST